MAMVKGQKVVCINDQFSTIVRAIYKQLPVKGITYTIREVFLGREKVVKAGDSATVGLLLVELVNPPDPLHKGQQELGFNSERFAPLEELPAEVAAEEVAEPIGVGSWGSLRRSQSSLLDGLRTDCFSAEPTCAFQK